MYNFQPDPKVSVWGDQREAQTAEAAQLFGRKIHYLKATNINVNEIFGEAVSRDFLAANAYEMYATRDDDTHFTGVESFGGYGLIPMYNDLLFLPIASCKAVNLTPYEGDLIYYEMESMMFEIVKVDTFTEEYKGDFVNMRRFNHKLYLKLYSPADDNFSGFTTLPAIETFDDAALLDVNSTLTTVIDNEAVVLPANANNPFGALN